MAEDQVERVYDTLYIERDVAERIRQLAEREGRTILGQVRIIVEAYDAQARPDSDAAVPSV